MLLPYTVEIFFSTMARYNAALFPAALVGLLLALGVLGLVVRPVAGAAVRDRLVGAVLAAGWVWVGWQHQLELMATLNFLAPVYGVAWIVQGALFALLCAGFARVRFGFAGGAAGWAGLALALFGLAGYPLLVGLLGFGWRGLPLAGTAPDPTAIFTAGLLLLAQGRWRYPLLLVPLGWAGVAAVSAYLLEFPLDYTVTAAVLIALAGALGTDLRPKS